MDGRRISHTHHRYRYANFHTELIIENVQPVDEATFTCHGTNRIDSNQHSIFLDVQGTHRPIIIVSYIILLTYNSSDMSFEVVCYS